MLKMYFKFHMSYLNVNLCPNFHNDLSYFKITFYKYVFCSSEKPVLDLSIFTYA